MSLKEIEKLRERLDKDPNSKLYVPLAEEYRKIGLLDEAIEVLQSCIEKQPSYMSARVSLGRIYLEKDQTEDARGEFEQVIKTIPDNLYSIKKLAEIYKDSGENELAIGMFKSLLKLSPMDEDALNCLSDLQRSPEEKTAEVLETAVSAAANDGIEEENLAGNIDAAEGLPIADTAEAGDNLENFKDSLFGLKEALLENAPEDAEKREGQEGPEETGKQWSFGDMEEEPADETPEELSPDPGYKAEETGGQWSFGDMEEEPADETPEELSPDPEYNAEGTVEQWSIKDVEEEQTEESSIGIPDYSFTRSLTDNFNISSADPRSVDQAVSESVEMSGAPGDPEAGSDNSKPALLDAAEKFISEGEYTGAISAYQRILSANPYDKQTLQRMEELRCLLKLMGREKDFLVSKLNAFLSAIQKRGDEFFRSA